MHPFNPNGLFGLGSNAIMPAQDNEFVSSYPNAMMPAARAPAAIPSWRRRAAWINTAGSFDMTWCVDARGRLIHRDAENGSHYAWDAHHVIPPEQGGADDPGNLRALNSSSHR